MNVDISLWFVYGALWILSLLIVVTFVWIYMDTRNLNRELYYMHQYRSAISSEQLQDLMCNGEPN